MINMVAVDASVADVALAGVQWVSISQRKRIQFILGVIPKMHPDPYLPYEAEIIERVEETTNVFTLHLRFSDPEVQANYRFSPGQFNMVYLYGVGEVAISIVSDPQEEFILSHSIRAVGRVTNGLAKLKPGDKVGIRGPYGRGWPLEQARGRDVVLMTGGLGCAPAVSVIHYVMRRRDQFGRMVIMQGVKHEDDLIWSDQYSQWSKMHDTQVLLAADVAGPAWPYVVGRVIALLDEAQFNHDNCMVMMCGPEIMMRFTVQNLLERGIEDKEIWLSMERNMQCAVGLCGHCQYGPDFICHDGPVLAYHRLQDRLGKKGY